MKLTFRWIVSIIAPVILTGTLPTLVYGLDTTIHGFVDGRAGVRTQSDPYEDDRSLSELRLQLDVLTYFSWGEIQVRGDFLYDDLAADNGTIDLETGEGFLQQNLCPHRGDDSF